MEGWLWIDKAGVEDAGEAFGMQRMKGAIDEVISIYITCTLIMNRGIGIK